MSLGKERPRANRAFQLILIVSTLAVSWLGMMAVHEFGHVLFAWLSDGQVARVVLRPLEFSRTELSRNPHPLFVASGGAVIGVTLPLAISTVWRFFRWPAWYVFQFFAGFCLVADGIYLGVVSFIPNAADPGDLMREGTPRWILVAFGAAAFPLGLLLWNGLGRHFGLGDTNGKVNRKVAVWTGFCFLALILLEVLFSNG